MHCSSTLDTDLASRILSLARAIFLMKKAIYFLLHAPNKQESTDVPPRLFLQQYSTTCIAPFLMQD
jgi:hypothetical protein